MLESLAGSRPHALTGHAAVREANESAIAKVRQSELGDGVLVRAYLVQATRTGRARERDDRFAAFGELTNEGGIAMRLSDDPVTIPLFFGGKRSHGHLGG